MSITITGISLGAILFMAAGAVYFIGAVIELLKCNFAGFMKGKANKVGYKHD